MLENKVAQPDSYEDSLFAIIDLSHAMLLMENSTNKSSTTTLKFPNYQVKSHEEHIVFRDHYLGLLGLKATLPRAEASAPDEMNAVPRLVVNSSANKDEVEFVISSGNSQPVKLQIFSSTGMLIDEVALSPNKLEQHQIRYVTTSLKHGVYLVRLLSKNGTIDTARFIK